MGRYLIADDEKHITNLLVRNLERQGHSVTAVDDGAKAIAELERDPSYTHAILDLMMPFSNGIEVLKWIRTHESTKRMWVCIMSAQAEALRHEPMEYWPDLWMDKSSRDSWFFS